MQIIDYGYDEKIYGKSLEENIGRVIAIYKDRYDCITDKGCFSCKLKKSNYYSKENSIFPTVGDFVVVNINETGDSQIIETLSRKSCFKRLDPDPNKMHEQLIAANFDYVFIMQSLNNNFNVRRLERYLALAWDSNATPIVILTKADLVDNYSQMLYETEEVALGANIHVISTKTGFGLSELQKYFKPQKTIVFLGSSGVGKSTLVNKLAGHEIMQTSEIRQEDSKGRHTTTTRQLIMLSSGTMVIDTPGLRELGMLDTTTGIDKTFADVEKYIIGCKYSNCTHTSEPGCAILEAIADGKLTFERYNSYIKLKSEAEYIKDSESYIKSKKEKFKQIAKQNKNNTKGIY